MKRIFVKRVRCNKKEEIKGTADMISFIEFFFSAIKKIKMKYHENKNC